MISFAFTIFSLTLGICAILITPAFIGIFLSVPYICATSWDKSLTDNQKNKALIGNTIFGGYLIFFKSLAFNISLLNFKKPKTLFFTILYNIFAFFILYKIYQFIVWFLTLQKVI